MNSSDDPYKAKANLEIISELFSRINEKSSSPYHILAHKLYVQQRLLYRGSRTGDLIAIGAEVELGNWTADVKETVKLHNSKIVERCVEVFTPLGYPHTFWVENSHTGRKRAKEFAKFLVENNYVNDHNYRHLEHQIAYKAIGRNHSEKKKIFIHFWLDGVDLDRFLDMNFNSFVDDIDNPTELERKYLLWNNQTDVFGILIPVQRLPIYSYYIQQLRKRLGKNLKLDMIATIDEKDINEIFSISQNKKKIKAKVPIKIPEEKRVIEMYRIEDLFG
jgi:hypothetical protein